MANNSGGALTQTIASTPVTSVDKTTGLKVGGETITVSGAGFSGAGSGIYVGLVQDNKFSATNAGAWMTTKWITATEIVGGTWSASVEVKAVVDASDCTVNSCSIYTIAAHGSSDRTQDTVTPVQFATATPTTTTTRPSTTTATPTTTTAPTTTTEDTDPIIEVPVITTTKAPTSNGGASVSADRTSGLNAAGDTISISGSGFSTSGPGIYVGVAQTNRYSATDASVFQDAKFVKPADMPGGSWSVSLDVSSMFTGSDCIANSCAIYTLAAHGSSDRSQDTRTVISFVGTPDPSATTGTTSAPGTSGTSTGTSKSGLSVTLSKSSNITPTGESVTISGSGFSGAAPGIYVGLVQDNVFNSSDASVWMTTAFIKPDAISGGNWSTTMELAAVQGNFDCIRNTCSIYTVAAHGSSDRSQDSKTPVGFVGGVAPGTVTAPPVISASGNAASTVSVTLSKSSGLEDGDKITVSGAGFSSSGPGVYVGLIQDSKFSTTDAGAWMSTAFITPSKIKDGAWSTSVEVKAVKGDSDCTKNACSIYTIAAHGSSDRSQDSKTPVTFGDDPAAADSEKSEAELAAAGLNADGTPTSSSSNSAIRNLADTFTNGSGWILPLVIGGLLGAGLAMGTTYAMRRRT